MHVDTTGRSIPAAWASLMAVGLVLLVALRIHYGIDNLVDDAYITLRHSLHIARGEGFVYNTGERVLGTTTPLYAGLVGIVGAAHPTSTFILWLAVLFNLACDAAIYLLLARLAMRLTGSAWFAAAVAICYALNQRSIEYSSGGMEVSFYTALILGALTLLFDGRDVWAGLVSGLVVLCRPDGLWLYACVMVALAWRRRTIPWRPLAVSFAVIAPWVAFATWYYGQPVPQSVLAKAARPWHLPWYHATLQMARQWGGLYFGRELFFDAALRTKSIDPANYVLAGAACAINLALAALGIRAIELDRLAPAERCTKQWDKRQRAFALAICVGFVLGYAFMYAWGNPQMFGWYQVPLEPFGLLFVGAGLWWMLMRTAPARPAVAVALLVALQASHFLSRDNYVGTNILVDRWDKFRERRYIKLTREMNAVVGERTVIANPEIGAFGYFSRAYILDPVGLVTRGVSSYYPLPSSRYASSSYAVPTQLLLDKRPDYFVCLEIFIRHTCLVSEEFKGMYALDAQVDDPIFNSKGLMVFRRRDLPRLQIDP